MPDYKEMYLKMMRASEKALREMEAASAELIAAQRACEEMYISQPEAELKVIEKGKALPACGEGGPEGAG